MVGTLAGLAFYDKNTNQFTSFRNNEKNENSLVDNDVKAIVEDAEGFFWIGTGSGL